MTNKPQTTAVEAYDTGPTPLNDLPLAGYVAEIGRLSEDLDFVRIMVLQRWNCECERGQKGTVFECGRCAVLARIEERSRK